MRTRAHAANIAKIAKMSGALASSANTIRFFQGAARVAPEWPLSLEAAALATSGALGNAKMSAKGKSKGPPAVALRGGRKSNLRTATAVGPSLAAQRLLKAGAKPAGPYSFSRQQIEAVEDVSLKQAQAMAAWMQWLGSEGRTTPARLATVDLPEGEDGAAEWEHRATRVILIRQLRMAITAVRHAGGSQADCAWLHRLIEYILQIDANRPCPVLTSAGTNQTKSVMQWQCRAMVAAGLNTLIEARRAAGLSPAEATRQAIEIVEPYLVEAQAADFGVSSGQRLTADSVESRRSARLSSRHVVTWRNQLNSGKGKGVPPSAVDLYEQYRKQGHEFSKSGVGEADLIARSYLRVACKASLGVSF